MSVSPTAIRGAEAAQSAMRDWQAVHGDDAIQYAPVAVPPPPKPPGWLEALARILRAIFEPVGRALGMSWPVVQWLVLGALAAALLYAIWRVTEPWREQVRAPAPQEAEPGWAPERTEALALLADADRLAAAGDFDAATHLLLRRSVAQIAAARPDWVHPATTARDLAALPALSERARAPFALIAARVERCRFALRQLAESDWQAARAAYAEFAEVSLEAAR